MPSLLIICQVYPPDPAAVGQHVADVAEEMVRRGWSVRVWTSARGYEDPRVRYPAREVRAGVQVRRLPLSSFGKGSIAVRLVAQALFMIQATVRALFTPGASAILVSTSPPFAGFGGCLVAVLRRLPLVWWVMDINPDQMVEVAIGRPVIALAPRASYAADILADHDVGPTRLRVRAMRENTYLVTFIYLVGMLAIYALLHALPRERVPGLGAVGRGGRRTGADAMPAALAAC